MDYGVGLKASCGCWGCGMSSCYTAGPTVFTLSLHSSENVRSHNALLYRLSLPLAEANQLPAISVTVNCRQSRSVRIGDLTHDLIISTILNSVKSVRPNRPQKFRGLHSEKKTTILLNSGRWKRMAIRPMTPSPYFRICKSGAGLHNFEYSMTAWVAQKDDWMWWINFLNTVFFGLNYWSETKLPCAKKSNLGQNLCQKIMIWVPSI